MHKIIALLCMSFGLTSCATICNNTIGLFNPIVCVTEFADATMGVSLTTKDLNDVRAHLLEILEPKYLVSDEIPSLDKNESFVIQYYSDIYETTGKGILGLGPVWEEKIRVKIIGVNNPEQMPEWKGYIKSETKVFERQKGSTKGWRPKNGDAHDRGREEKLLKFIRTTITEVL